MSKVFQIALCLLLTFPAFAQRDYPSVVSIWGGIGWTARH